MNRTPLKQVANKCCLEVIVDEKLNYKNHRDSICSTVLKTQQTRSSHTVNQHRDEHSSLQNLHHNSSQMDIYPIWCRANHAHKQKVEYIHRQALISVSVAISTTAKDDLEVLLHVEPIKFRLDEVLMPKYARVMSKKPGHHLRNVFEEIKKNEVFMDHRTLPPLHAQKMVLRDIEDSLFSRVKHATIISLGSHPRLKHQPPGLRGQTHVQKPRLHM